MLIQDFVGRNIVDGINPLCFMTTMLAKEKQTGRQRYHPFLLASKKDNVTNVALLS